MPRYQITARYDVERTFEVDADSAEDAYHNPSIWEETGEVVLDRTRVEIVELETEK